MVAPVRSLARSLQPLSADELIREAAHLRTEFCAAPQSGQPEQLVAGIALVFEALRRAHKVELYDVQLTAVLQLAQGHIAQMQTGEGKTFVAIATAGFLAIPGSGVHVMTPNSYLAERDCNLAIPVMQQLGMTVGLTPEQGETSVKQAAYDCDVTYGTGHEFGFDYLRDQLTLRREQSATLGSRLLRDLQQTGPDQRATMQRGLVHAVVDEADSVLIDDAASPLVLSVSQGDRAIDHEAHLVACEVAGLLQPEEHYRIDVVTGKPQLLPDGQQRCYADDIAIPTAVLQRPWTDYVEQALRAEHTFRRNVHYVVEDEEVRIVDETTGRIFEDRSWQDGLHQAIEAREGLPITAEKESLAQITRQRFFRLYQNLCGMTGTAVGCEAELRVVYRSEVAEIPLRRPSQRIVRPTRFFATRADKHLAIVESVRELHDQGRPVLIGTQSISESCALARLFTERGLVFQLLNGLQNEEEADIVHRAGELRAITIATNLAGRGTDIPVARVVLERGGLHVVVAECQLSSRMDRQLVGRGARQGNAGSAETFVSAEDTLIQRYGGWLGAAICREAGATGEADVDFSRQLRRLQGAAEKLQFHARAELLRRDISRDNLFGNAADDA
ncbi:MAG: helicase-related protein [Planctomycetaceae bacterium]|nr:helicase-related protein [Planctomycetaceae bacterium]